MEADILAMFNMVKNMQESQKHLMKSIAELTRSVSDLKKAAAIDRILFGTDKVGLSFGVFGILVDPLPAVQY